MGEEPAGQPASAAPSGETAIIIPVDVPVAVRRLRDRMDPSAAVGVPAHVTLLWPFMPLSELAESVTERVRMLVAREPQFPFAFSRVGRWPDIVYLAPEPSEPFTRLINALAADFPDYPPYGGAHAEVVPHLTIAHVDRPDYLAAAAHALPQMLPFRAVAREAVLIGHEPGRRWSTLAQLPLGAAPDR